MNRAVRTLLRPRLRRVDVAVAAVLAVLGFALVVQVHSTRSDGLLASARTEDLVQILDDLSNRDPRLRMEVDSLSRTRQQLTSGAGATQAALAEARRRTQVLGVLAGTVAATGPGITLTIADPRTQVSADALLDALEELRDAGAEALQLEGTGPRGSPVAVRVVAATALLDERSGVSAGGTALRAPYRFVVLGDPGTLSAALAIPGGVLDTVHQQGGTTAVARLARLRVSALRPLEHPRYARPVPPGTG